MLKGISCSDPLLRHILQQLQQQVHKIVVVLHHAEPLLQIHSLEGPELFEQPRVERNPLGELGHLLRAERTQYFEYCE